MAGTVVEGADGRGYNLVILGNTSRPRLSPKCARLTGHRHRKIRFCCAHPQLKGRCAHLFWAIRPLDSFVCAHFGEKMIRLFEVELELERQSRNRTAAACLAKLAHSNPALAWLSAMQMCAIARFRLQAHGHRPTSALYDGSLCANLAAQHFLSIYLYGHFWGHYRVLSFAMLLSLKARPKE